MIVVLNPDFHRFCSGRLGVVGPRIEAFLGQNPLISLDLAVMPRRVGPDPLMDPAEVVHRLREDAGSEVHPVIGDHPAQPGDALGGEECSGLVQELHRGGGLLVLDHLGVGKAGVSIDCRVQVGIAADLVALLLRGALRPAGGASGLGVSAVGELAHRPRGSGRPSSYPGAPSPQVRRR